MPMTNDAFHLTDDQLRRLNDYIDERRAAYRAADENPAIEFKVIFEWSPPMGRFVTAHYDGHVDGRLIEGEEWFNF